jgi:hypothetical protein
VVTLCIEDSTSQLLGKTFGEKLDTAEPESPEHTELNILFPGLKNKKHNADAITICISYKPSNTTNHTSRNGEPHSLVRRNSQ